MLYNPRQDQVSRDILMAASIIRDGGLCKGMLWDNKGAHCINGALMNAIGGEDSFKGWYGEQGENREYLDRCTAAQARISEQLGVHYAPGHCSEMVKWNNRPERTKDEVVDALCEAAGVNAEVLV